jgi:hypothetical protein
MEAWAPRLKKAAAEPPHSESGAGARAPEGILRCAQNCGAKERWLAGVALLLKFVGGRGDHLFQGNSLFGGDAPAIVVFGRGV